MAEKRREEDKDVIFVPVYERDEYEPFGERHPKRRQHALFGALYLALALGLLVAPGRLLAEAGAWVAPAMAGALALYGALLAAEGLASPVGRASAVLHVVAAAASLALLLLSGTAAFLLLSMGAFAGASLLALVALTVGYRLMEHRKSTREAWAVARKGAPAWWQTGSAPRNRDGKGR